MRAGRREKFTGHLELSRGALSLKCLSPAGSHDGVSPESLETDNV